MAPSRWPVVVQRHGPGAGGAPPRCVRCFDDGALCSAQRGAARLVRRAPELLAWRELVATAVDYGYD